MQTKLIEVFQSGTDTAGVLDLPAKYWPAPGQYLPCQRLTGKPDVLVTNLFRVSGEGGRLSMGPLPEDWQPGDPLACRPPQGNGFTLPPTARRIALIAFESTPSHLLPLIEPAVRQDASVALFCQPLPTPERLAQLPSLVEVGPLSALLDNLSWPDFVAVDINRDMLPHLSSFFGQQELSFDAQVLIHTPMPCRGLGDCGVCAVKTSKGWRLACVDGPVFSLQEIRHVAQ